MKKKYVKTCRVYQNYSYISPVKLKNDKDMAEKKLWLRLGVEVSVDEETIAKLMNGNDSSILAEIVKNGHFQLDGESYIPSTIIEEYNEENGTNFELDDVSYFYDKNLSLYKVVG